MHTRQSLTACKSDRRPNRPQRTRVQGPVAFTFAASLSWGALSPALAGPTGGVVVEGQGTISTPGAGQTQIDQTSSNLHLNWNTFDVAANESVRFNQPSSSAVAFNRILDQNPSQIHGSIQANGQVVLVNPNGLLIGRSAQLNVGSLVVSSLDAIDFDSTTGRYRFSTSRNAPGAVLNEGTISAGAGGSVTLLGGRVSNTGTIVADLGTVNLAAGRTATLDLAGDGLLRLEVGSDLLANTDGSADAVHNSGTVQANGGHVLLTASAVQDVFTNLVNNTGVVRAGRIDNSGGTIRLIGPGGTVRSSGTLDASAGDSVSTGGSVAVLGERVGLFGDAVVDVSGATGGGQALIGGDFQGRNPDVLNASRTYVGADATINADAGAAGDGGRVIVWADDLTRFDGSISARGGAASGNGGFAEVSGKELLIFTGMADLRAPHGASGTLLLDPDDIIIDDSSAAPTAADDGTYAFGDDPGTTGTIGNATIETLLQAGNVTLQANNTIVQNADADIDSPDGNDLNLQAGDDITLNGDINLTGGALNVTSTAGNVVLAGAYDVGAAEVIATAGGIQVGTLTASGDVTLDAGGGSIVESGTSSITAANLTLTASDSIGVLGDAINTTATSLTATAADGDVYVDETDDLTLTSVSAGGTNHDVVVTSGGNITATSVAANGDSVALTAAGGIAVGSITANDVTLVSNGGAITDGGGSSISATTASLTASTGIGASGNGINTTVGTLTANSNDGGVFIDETDGLTLTNVTAGGTGNVGVTTALGDITATSVTADSSTVTLTATTGGIAVGGISAGNVTLNANGGAITEAGGGRLVATTSATLNANTNIGADGSEIATAVPSLTAISGSGGVFIDESDVIQLTNVTANGVGNVEVTTGAGNITAVSVTATGDVTLTAAGGIAVGGISANDVTLNAISGSITEAGGSSIAAVNATLTASGSIGFDGNEIDTTVSSLTATTTATATGGVYIDESDGLALTNVTANGNGNIEVTTAAGNITATSVTATGNTVTLTATAGGVGVGTISAANVTLNANSGGITESGTSSITATNATLTASGGIGTDATRIGTTVGTLTATATNGSVFIDETDGLTLASVSAGGGNNVEITTTAGSIEAGSVSATGTVRLSALAGAITDDDDDLTTINGTVRVELDAGSALGTIDDFDLLTGSALDVQTLGTLDASVTSNTGEINLNLSGAPTLAPGAITLGSGSGRAGSIIVQSAGTLNAAGFAAGAISIGSANTTSVALSSGGTLILPPGGGFTDQPADTLYVRGVTDVVNTGATPRDFVFGANNLRFESGGAGGPVTLNTTVGTLNATLGNAQTLTITETDDVTLGTVSGGSVAIVAGGAIADDGADATRVSGSTVSLTGTSIGTVGGSALETTATTLNATASAGGVSLRELNGVTLTASATGGAVDVQTDNGGISVASATGTGVTLVAGGAGSALALNGAVNGGSGNVTLTAGTPGNRGDITGAGHVSGNALTATGASIGTSGARLTTTVGSLDATSTGGTFVTETGPSLSLTANAGGAVDVQTTGGALTAAAVTGNGVTLSTAGNGNALSVTGPLNAGAGAVALSTSGDGSDISVTGSVTSSAGDISLVAGGAGSDISLGGTISTSGNVALTAGSIANRGAILTSAGNQVAGGALTAVGSAIGNSSFALNTNVQSIDATSTNGDIRITEGNGVSLTANATGGQVEVITASGSMTVGTASGTSVVLEATDDITVNGAVNASTGAAAIAAGDELFVNGAITGATGVRLATGGTITLNAAVTGPNLEVTAGIVGNRAAIVAGAGNLLSGTDLTLRGASVGGVGSRLNTAVSSIDALTSNGSIFVSEADALALNAVAGPGGTLDVQTSNGALTVASAVGDGVTLATGGDGNGITVNGGTGVQGRAGAVSITTAGAGSHIVLNDAVSTTNQLNLTTGAGGDIVVNSAVDGGISAQLTAGTAADRGDVVAGAASNLAGQSVAILAASVGSSTARLNTAASMLNTNSTAGGTYITNQGDLTLASNATGGALDVATTNGSMTVNAVAGDSITLAAGGAGSGIAINNGINTPGDVTLSAGSATSRGAISFAPGASIGANALTATASAIGTPGARVNTTVSSLNATTSGGGIYVTESDALILTANATGGAVDVQTSNGALTVTGANGTGVTLVAGGAGSGITLNGAVNAGTGDVTLTAGTQANRGAIVAGAGNLVSGEALTATGSAIGGVGAGLNTNVGTLTAAASNGGVYISEQNALTLASVTASGAAGDVDVASASGDVTVRTVTASRNATLNASAGAIVDDGDDTSRVTAGVLTLSARSIGAPSTLSGGGVDSSLRVDTAVTTLNATATSGGIFVDELDGLSSVSVEAGGGTVGDIELLTATGDLNLQSVTASDTLLLAAGHNIFARPGSSPITARVAELRAGGADPAAGQIGTSSQLLELNLSPGNSLRLFVPQTIDPLDPTRAPATLPSTGVTTTLSLFGAPDTRATSAGFNQYQSVSDSPFTSAAEALVRTVQNQTTTVQSVLGLDWASFDTNVSLFGTLEPAVCLPSDQRDEEEGDAGC